MTVSSKTAAAEGKRGPYTVDDYMAMPDDGQRYELLDGELVVAAAPRDIHQTVLMNLAWLLHGHVRKRERQIGRALFAPFDVVLSRWTVCQPDLLFVSAARLKLLDGINLKGAPDLAVEILSPSRERYDRVIKMRLYAEAGVRHYWIVDAGELLLEEYALDEATGAYRSVAAPKGREATFQPKVFPGVELPLAEIFWDV